MQKIVDDNFPFFRFENLASLPGVRHFVSSGARTVGFGGRDSDAEVRASRLALAEVAGFSMERLVMGQQVHGTHVEVVTDRHAGRGAFDRDSRLPETDALVTDCPDICLMVLSADCVPVLLYDPVCRVVGAVHAGWRGTVAGIVEKTVGVLVERFGSRPEDLYAGIGPSIGVCCFEVGEEVAEAFHRRFPGNPDIVVSGERPGKFRVDLWEANRRMLLAAGLMAEHVEVAGMCTVCHPGHFFSYRREKEAAGRFGAGILLAGE